MHDMRLLEEVLVPVNRPQGRVLIVAQEIELRARIARVLQSAGHSVELAGSRARALELAAGKKIERQSSFIAATSTVLGRSYANRFHGRSCWTIEGTGSVGRNVGPTCLRKNSMSK